jgi:hypothetical protein
MQNKLTLATVLATAANAAQAEYKMGDHERVLDDGFDPDREFSQYQAIEGRGGTEGQQADANGDA